jgi:2-methylcitrate dehydratase PrpD
MTAEESQPRAVAEVVAGWLAATTPEQLPAAVVETARKLFLDVTGLCVAARRQKYVTSTVKAADPGSCTAFGHPGGFDAFGAALINGTGAHGEDYDDTFEGGPVHTGAVIIPAVLAACERFKLSGDRCLVGTVTGAELLCRLSLVAPTATHRAGFHPTSVFGTVAAAGAVAATLQLPPPAIASALGIAGSMASGIIEYLAEGTWTKRMHAGWAAQSGLRAALMAQGGFIGPRTVLEGTRGLYHAFAPSAKPDWDSLTGGLGTCWRMPAIAFKPHACGTMTQPFIDCAIRLADEGVRADEILDIVCEVAEATVDRLWEPLAVKYRPPTSYAAKFSTPFCIAVAFFDRKAGIAQFSDARISDPSVLALAGRIRYVVNQHDEYPRKFSGHLRVTLKDGSIREYRQPHFRGGAEAPLSADELEMKFMENALSSGWDRSLVDRLRQFARDMFALPRLTALEEFRA